MKRVFLAAFVALVGAALAVPAMAGVIGDGSPVFALHVAPHGKAGTICDPPQNPVGVNCTGYSVSASSGSAYDVYLVVAAATDTTGTSGIRGASCGVDYNATISQGIDVFQWTLCTDGLQFPNEGPNGEWPAAGGGNRMTWTTCVSTGPDTTVVQATFGVFYIYAYSDDRFQITPNMNVAFPELAVTNCTGADEFIEFQWAAWADFGTGSGCNPCNIACPVPVDPTTWGNLKSRFRGE